MDSGSPKVHAGRLPRQDGSAGHRRETSKPALVSSPSPSPSPLLACCCETPRRRVTGTPRGFSPILSDGHVVLTGGGHGAGQYWERLQFHHNPHYHHLVVMGSERSHKLGLL